MATLRQKRAAKILAENGGKSVSAVMREVGYSPETASTPSKLTESKAWPALVEEMLPDTLLTKVHKEGLEANRVISARVTNKDANVDTDDFIEVPDHQTRHRFLETAYKIKGKMTGDTVNVAVIVPVIIKPNGNQA